MKRKIVRIILLLTIAAFAFGSTIVSGADLEQPAQQANEDPNFEFHDEIAYLVANIREQSYQEIAAYNNQLSQLSEQSRLLLASSSYTSQQQIEYNEIQEDIEALCGNIDKTKAKAEKDINDLLIAKGMIRCPDEFVEDAETIDYLT